MVFCSAVLNSDWINALLKPAFIHQRVYTDPKICHLQRVRLLERTRASLRTSQDRWINSSRGTGTDYDVNNGKRSRSDTSEMLHRARYDMWLSFMTATSRGKVDKWQRN